MRVAGKAVALYKGTDCVHVEAGSEAEAYWTEKGYAPSESKDANAAETESVTESKKQEPRNDFKAGRKS